jgi:hypothetical protein
VVLRAMVRTSMHELGTGETDPKMNCKYGMCDG